MPEPIPRRFAECLGLVLPHHSIGSAFEAAAISLCSGLRVCSPPRSFLPLGSRGFLQPSTTCVVTFARIGHAFPPDYGQLADRELSSCKRLPLAKLPPVADRSEHVEFDKSVGPFRRALHYAFYDWTREMPRSKRFITWAGVLIQGYAVHAGITRSLIWPWTSPRWPLLLTTVWLLYVVGGLLINWMLTSEFFRKTQLESDQIAARQIQQTLHPEKLEPLPGYLIETFYKPLRDVGGDYFDVVELPDSRKLFALADVAGKGMPAALLAANIQVLVRSLASAEADPLTLSQRINQHLNRYTPIDRFATAVFIALSRESGELTCVNAGHNAPIVFCNRATTLLEATACHSDCFLRLATNLEKLS
jgi:hypothetical protein